MSSAPRLPSAQNRASRAAGAATKIQPKTGARKLHPSVRSNITSPNTRKNPRMTKAAANAAMQAMTQVARKVQLADVRQAWRKFATSPFGLQLSSPHSGQEASTSRPVRS